MRDQFDRCKWDHRHLGLAEHISQWSKDRSTKVGCVVAAADGAVLTTGYNGFPRGVNDTLDQRHERPAKYQWTEHAERNAIYNAARHGIGLEGATIYVPWYPCIDCARAIIQCGITSLVCHQPDFKNERWGKDFKVVVEMLREVRLNVRYLEDWEDG